MPSKFDQQDTEFVRTIRNEMLKRRDANVNDSEGVAHYPGISTDEIFPQVFITKEDIRDATGRDKVRDSVLQKLQKDLENGGLKASIEDKKLKVEILPEKSRQTSFNSFNSLKQANIQTEQDYQNSRDEYETEENFQADNPFREPY